MTDKDPPDPARPGIADVDRILRLPDVMRLTGLSRSQIMLAESQGKFPRRRRLLEDGRAVGWLHSELIEWIRTRPKA